MKHLLTLSVVALFSLSLFAACGGGSDGPSCADVCGKMVECNVESNLAECEASCTVFKDKFRDNVFAELGDCFMSHTCEELENGGDMCMEAAAALGDTNAARGLIDDMCVKYVECDTTGMMTQESCVSQFEEQAGEYLQTIGMFTDSVLNCTGNCIGDLSCAELENEDDDALEACMEDCGLLLD